jgi:hypothetical protein
MPGTRSTGGNTHPTDAQASGVTRRHNHFNTAAHIRATFTGAEKAFTPYSVDLLPHCLGLMNRSPCCLEWDDRTKEVS